MTLNNSEVTMKSEFLNDFVITNFYEFNKSLLVIWLPENQSMSRSEFWHTVEFVVNTVTICNPEKVLIDAFEYAYPIIPEEIIRYIRHALPHDALIIKLGLVQSSTTYGRFAISNILKRLADIKLDIVVFNTSKDGLDWFLS